MNFKKHAGDLIHNWAAAQGIDVTVELEVLGGEIATGLAEAFDEGRKIERRDFYRAREIATQFANCATEPVAEGTDDAQNS